MKRLSILVSILVLTAVAAFPANGQECVCASTAAPRTVSLCGEHDDDKAYDAADPDTIYGPILELGTSIIQTDRPEFLIRYLEQKGRR